MEKQQNERSSMADSRINDAEIAKYTIKDSVFTNLFQDKKYLIQLYRALHPEYLSLSEEFFGGQKGFLDVKVKVLYGDDKDDIISQYVTFTKVYNEQMKVHGRTREAIMETIRICKDKNVLKEYLESREKEGARCPVDICSARTGVERRRVYYVSNV